MVSNINAQMSPSGASDPSSSYIAAINTTKTDLLTLQQKYPSDNPPANDPQYLAETSKINQDLLNIYAQVPNLPTSEQQIATQNFGKLTQLFDLINGDSMPLDSIQNFDIMYSSLNEISSNPNFEITQPFPTVNEIHGPNDIFNAMKTIGARIAQDLSVSPTHLVSTFISNYTNILGMLALSKLEPPGTYTGPQLHAIEQLDQQSATLIPSFLKLAPSDAITSAMGASLTEIASTFSSTPFLPNQ